MDDSSSNRALSNLTELGLKSQLDEAESLDVKIDASAADVMGGRLQGVEIEGQGLTLKDDLRMDELHLETDAIAINPLSVALGNIELTETTDATAKVVLTQADINRAITSDYLKPKLDSLKITVSGQPVTVRVIRFEAELIGAGKVHIDAVVQLPSGMKAVGFTTEPQVSPNHQRIVLANLTYDDGKSLPEEYNQALEAQASRLLNFSNFELDGMDFSLEALEITKETISLTGAAVIRDFPG